MNNYTVGTKLFCDFALSGKPKAKCIAVIKPGNGKDIQGCIRVKITEDFGAYKKGEIIEISTYQAIPEKQEIKPQKGQFYRRLRTDYQWILPESKNETKN